MNFRRMTEDDLAAMADNMVTMLAGAELSSININVRAQLIAALGTLPDALRAEVMLAMVHEDERMAAVTRRNAAKAKIEDWVSQVRDLLKGGLAPDEQYDLCGLRHPVMPVHVYVAQTPADLSVTAYATGVNKCRFKGNNRYAHASYEIWRRAGNDETWNLLATTKKQSFADAPVKPGQSYQYRVRAVAPKTVSNFSDIAAVYSDKI
ncbi:MAG: fibronectin type III domain-containing protein [Pyrinomonadaceae bacterium]